VPGPVELRQFLATALQRTLPDGQINNFTDFSEEVQATVSLDAAASRIEIDQLEITAAGTEAPQFDFPAQEAGSIAIYHHIGIDRLDVPDVGRVWCVLVRYPRWGAFMDVASNPVATEAVDLAPDILKLGSSTSNNAPTMYGLPFMVFEGGEVRVTRKANILVGQRVRCKFLRQIIPGPFDVRGVNVITGTFV